MNDNRKPLTEAQQAFLAYAQKTGLIPFGKDCGCTQEEMQDLIDRDLIVLVQSPDTTLH